MAVQIMTELDKAQAYICDKNTNLAKLSRESGIPLPTLKAYRSTPDRLETTAWNRVHDLAGRYERKMGEISVEVQQYEEIQRMQKEADEVLKKLKKHIDQSNL